MTVTEGNALYLELLCSELDDLVDELQEAIEANTDTTKPNLEHPFVKAREILKTAAHAIHLIANNLQN